MRIVRFQFTLPRGERRLRVWWPVPQWTISIHAPTRGATKANEKALADFKISIHAPTRGATVLCRQGQHRQVISIHAPTRGATKVEPRYVPFDLNFNSRSHAGSDVGRGGHRRLYRISIHAPTRGATRPAVSKLRTRRSISIHAPTRGATSTCPCPSPHRGNFNSRSHAGSDSPVRAAEESRQDFNSRSHAGSDTNHA